MTDFDGWLEDVVSQANLIASPCALTRAWIDQEKNITAAYDLNELLEQLLGDLHLEEHLLEFGDSLRHLDIFEAVAAFTQAALSLEKVAK